MRTMRQTFMAAVLLGISLLAFSQDDGGQVFKDGALRIDYLMGGTASTTEVFMEQVKKEPFYGGSRVNLIDRDDYGTFRYRMYHSQTGELVFSKGFCSLFQEWQTTPEAHSVKRSFYQVAILPYPAVRVRFTIERKTRDGHEEQLLSMEIDPDDYFIVNERVPDYPVEEIVKHGDPGHKVDLVFLPEGYTEAEMEKFLRDAERMTDILFAAEPFDRHKADFNVYAVKVPSLESGTDVPGERIYRNTAFGAAFYTFDVPRYLTTSAMKSIHDAASVVPCDQVCVLVNSNRYGGGGFYNFLTISTVGHGQAPQVLVHEFGHALAGLADEYYTSEVAYGDFYNLLLEPWEPNITTMVNFDRKWKDMLDRKTPVPTPREEKYRDTPGVFEGGGYVEKGIFSPMMDCRMKSNGGKEFCPVCQRAIRKAIDWHCR